MSQLPVRSALHFHLLALFGLMAGYPSLYAADVQLRLPDEIEAVGGQAAAQGHSGVASVSDVGAIRLNPAMLYQQRSYDISGAYYWPANGRSFYKVGVIDGVTSQMVAGLEYTGFQEPPRSRQELKDDEVDSPVEKRVSVAIAVPAQFFSLGLAAHYVESQDPASDPAAVENIKGISLGAGIVTSITETLRFGASAQNFNNKRVREVAPTVYRVGLSWTDRTGTVLVSGDLRQRDRSLLLELPTSPEQLALVQSQGSYYEKPERMGFVGLQAKTFNMMKIFAAYGRSFQGPERASASGGVGIFQKNFSFAYAIGRNFPDQGDLQSSLQLTVTMRM